MLTREEKNTRRRLRRLVTKGELMKKCADDAAIELVYLALGCYANKENLAYFLEQIGARYSAEICEFLNNTYENLYTRNAREAGFLDSCNYWIEEGKKAKQQLEVMGAA